MTRYVKGLALLCLLLIILIMLQGCLAPCSACVGPYDLGLSSHREALQRRIP